MKIVKIKLIYKLNSLKFLYIGKINIFECQILLELGI
jgi:hypothetical protein